MTALSAQLSQVPYREDFVDAGFFERCPQVLAQIARAVVVHNVAGSDELTIVVPEEQRYIIAVTGRNIVHYCSHW